MERIFHVTQLTNYSILDNFVELSIDRQRFHSAKQGQMRYGVNRGKRR